MDIRGKGTWRSVAVAALAVMVGSAYASTYVPPQGCSGSFTRCSQGYQFGRSNCGSAPTNGGLQTRSACKTCCKKGGELGIEGDTQILPGQIDNCESFCNQAMWPVKS